MDVEFKERSGLRNKLGAIGAFWYLNACVTGCNYLVIGWISWLRAWRVVRMNVLDIPRLRVWGAGKGQRD